MAEKGKHRLTDYERLMSSLPVNYRPALREERKHFKALNSPLALIATDSYDYESDATRPSMMLFEQFGWSSSKHGSAFWRACHELLIDRESRQDAAVKRKSAKTEKLNRLLKKQLDNAAR